jgi:Scaffold domain
MGKRFTLLAALALCSAAQSATTGWTPQQRAQLSAWLQTAPQEGLSVPARAEPTAQALELARAILLGNSAAKARAGWNIADSDQAIDLEARLAAALASDDLDGFFTGLRPRNPQYEALRLALRAETDPGRRTKLIRNLERWRWMPLDMGPRYLLVNVPGFELGLWEHGRKTGHWRERRRPGAPQPGRSAAAWLCLGRRILSPAARTGQRAGSDEIGDAQSLQGLSPRHLQQGAFRAAGAGLQPRLHPGRSGAGPGGKIAWPPD